MPQSVTTFNGHLRRIIERRVRASINRRHAVLVATATAVVLAAVGIIANSVVAVASSVASTGDGPGFRKRLRQSCCRRSCPDPVRWRPAEALGFIKLQLVFFLNPRQLQPDLPSINKIVKLYFVSTTSIERPEDSRLLCSLPLCAPDTRPVVQTRVQSVPVRHGVAQWGSAGEEPTAASQHQPCHDQLNHTP
jgi:hypothetical protein